MAFYTEAIWPQQCTCNFRQAGGDCTSGTFFGDLFSIYPDITVLGKSMKDHPRNLEHVFQRLRESTLKLNSRSVISVVSRPREDASFWEWSVPKDKHEVHSLIGFCTYHRLYGPGFATIAKSLKKLTEDPAIYEAELQYQRS